MTTYKVEPVPGFEDGLLKEYSGLPLACADGFSALMDILEENEPGLKDRCGTLADRYELYAIPLPDCLRRVMIVSVDRRASGEPRWIHGTLPASQSACEQGRQIAVRQFRLVDPSWEK
jgi:hypothetical protein